MLPLRDMPIDEANLCRINFHWRGNRRGGGGGRGGRSGREIVIGPFLLRARSRICTFYHMIKIINVQCVLNQFLERRWSALSNIQGFLNIPFEATEKTIPLCLLVHPR